MTKEELERLHHIFSNAHLDFLRAYPNYKNGRNKEIRKKAEREVDNAIGMVKVHLNNWDVLGLLAGDDADGFSRRIVYDEFILPQWFGSDMAELLKAIEEKIKSFE